MRIFNVLVLFLFCGFSVVGQDKLDKAIQKLNKNSVPYIQVNEVEDDAVLLDAREKREYEVSHLKDALWVGYDTFKIAAVQAKIPNKDTPISVYCSIGVRSEDVGEQLLAAGYTNVKNLYGGIFAWKNNEKPVYNTAGETNQVHAFDKQWGKLLKKGEKVYQ